MFRPFYLLVFLFLSLFINAQDIKVNTEGSSNLYLEILRQSKDLKYDEILSLYDRYIGTHPNNVQVKIERCKFIENAYYNEYDDYNPNYDLAENCIEDLISRYPNNPNVILYKIEYTWSEERIQLINRALSLIDTDKESWSYIQRSALYKVASEYYQETNDFLSISYAEKAVRYSDSLDMSLPIAEAYLRLGNEEKAKAVLMEDLYVDSKYAWTLKRKGDLLISFNALEEATDMFERAKQKDSTIIDYHSLYSLYIEKHKYDIARDYLVKDTINEWNKNAAIQKLLNHDIDHSDYDTAITTYRRMQQLNYYDDLFGIKRLQLYFKSPFKAWSFNDLSHLLWLLLLVAILFLVPYVWVLPIYGINKIFKIKIKKPFLNVDWTLRHFWLISFVYLISQCLLLLIFYYQDFINSYFEVSYDYAVGDLNSVSSTSAKANLFYFGLMFILCMFFLNKKRLKFLIHSNYGFGRIVLYTIGFIIINTIVIRLIRDTNAVEGLQVIMKSLNTREEVSGILNKYGFTVAFMAVAVIVPIYEELIFRGIILSSVEKQIGFIGANLLQAILFALIHMNLEFFMFYLIFGLITGYMVKKSSGLLVGIVFHAVNNFFVLFSLTILNSV